jgi:F0F1-type ATP synthase membrane subunit b/b'
LPFSRRTLVDEEQMIDQLDLVRDSLPRAFHQAQEILKQKQDIILQAEQYAQTLIEQAERRAAQILDETLIIQHAEREARQIRQQVQQECEAAQAKTLAEIEQLRRQAKQEVDALRKQAIAECTDMQRDADRYADRVLKSMEQQFAEMLRVIRNGRQQLQLEAAPNRAREPRDNQSLLVDPAPRPAPAASQPSAPPTPVRMPERIKG